MKRPNLFILGGQKCGTTALAHFLSQHPDIYLAEGKEAHAFDHPQVDPSDYYQIDRHYYSYFHQAHSEKYYCDATPIYSYWTELLPHITNYSPGSKAIFMVRDPVDRAVSQFIMASRHGYETSSMLKAFINESKRLESTYNLRKEWSSPARWLSYCSRGNFKHQVESIYDAFSESNVLVLHNNDLLNHHEQTLKRVCSFLDIPYYEVKAELVFSGNYGKPKPLDHIACLYARWKLKNEIKYVRQFCRSKV